MKCFNNTYTGTVIIYSFLKTFFPFLKTIGGVIISIGIGLDQGVCRAGFICAHGHNKLWSKCKIMGFGGLFKYNGINNHDSVF